MFINVFFKILYKLLKLLILIQSLRIVIDYLLNIFNIIIKCIIKLSFLISI